MVPLFSKKGIASERMSDIMAKLTREMVGKHIKAKVPGVQVACDDIEVLEFGACDQWCRLKAWACKDKKFCCGDEKAFKVAQVNVLSVIE